MGREDEALRGYVSRGYCPSKYSKATLPVSSTLSPPAALLSPEEGTGLELEKLRLRLPTCNQSMLLSPWTGAYMQEEPFFPKQELFLPKTVNQGACLQEREGRWPGGRASVSQGGTHSPSGSYPCLGLEPGGKKPRRKLRKHGRKPLRKS